MTTILVIPHVFLQYALEHHSTQAISYPPVYNYGTNSQKILNQADLVLPVVEFEVHVI
jgi:hypothetical protein